MYAYSSVYGYGVSIPYYWAIAPNYDATFTPLITSKQGPLLQGVKAVIAESFERIHRSNLVGMGVLPLQFKAGQNVDSLGLTGHEVFEITGISGDLKPQSEATVRAGTSRVNYRRLVQR